MTLLTVEPDESDLADDDRLAALYRVHATDTRRFAFLLCGDDDMAADLVQEAFLRVATRIGLLRSPDAFRSYLRRTVRNLVRQDARAGGRERARIDRAHRLDARRDDGRESEDPAGALWAALQRLPERQRTALICRFYLDLAERDTARVLRCRPGTVKSLVSRGLAALRVEGGMHELDG
jgi:RNA polymerase sigma factor (sigma-70 family)